MRKYTQIAGFAGVLWGASVATAQTRPATASVADYSTPKTTIKSFLTAPDEAGMRAALAFAPETQADAEAFLQVMVATTRLQKAAESQYGFSAAKYFSTSTQEQIDERVKSLDKALVEMSADGRKATVTIPANEAAKQSGAVIELNKNNDQWKIDAASLFGIGQSSKQVTAQRVVVAKSLTQVTEQMIKDLGKFASPAEAYHEYWNRSREALSQIPATQSK
jgi:hypothetical protein